MPSIRAAWLALTFLAAGCGPSSEPGGTPSRAQPPVIQIDGSSTVFPIAEAVAEEFQIATRVRVTVGVSGTGGGFKKFCRGETSISNASRPILAEEIAACAASGVRYIELPVALDAVTVVVNPANTWLTSISIDELRAMWRPEAQGQVLSWAQVNPAWPDQPMTLFGAGADSGTFDYFTEAVMGKAKSSRGDFTASEDDNVLVTGVANDVNAVGFFGYAYYRQNKDKLRAVPIRESADSAAVLPTLETVLDGSYRPMSRPAFIYVNAEHASARAEVTQLVEFFLKEAKELITEVGYIPLPDRAYELALGRLARSETGTVFEGHSEVGVSVETLLERVPK
jgi:phosphate transport system substrate-binding protein